MSPEEAFIADLEGVAGLENFREDVDLLAYGRRVCDFIGAPYMNRVAHALIISIDVRPKFSTAQPGAQLRDAAQRHLCPGKRYAVDPPTERVVIVPDVSGMTGDQASQAAFVAGILNVRFDTHGGSTRGKVASQRPDAGAQQTAGDEFFIDLEPSRAERLGN